MPVRSKRWPRRRCRRIWRNGRTSDFDNVQPDPGFGLSDDEFWTDVSQTTQSNGLPPSGEDDVTELDPVVVIGDGGGGSGGGGTGSGGPGGDGLPGDHDEIDEDPGQLDRPYDACEDRAADTLADKINDLIKSKPDSNRIEYGALIWRDADGQLHMTEVTPGNNDRWFPPSEPTGNGFDSWSQVVGYVHSHPTEVYRDGNWITVTPESHYERPSTGDWVYADSLIAREASANNFTIYVSYNGQVREYDSRSNTTQNRDINIPMAGHGNESGDYSPGTNCP